MEILVIGAGGVGIGLAYSVKSQGFNVGIYARDKTAKTIKKHDIKRIGLLINYKFSDVPVYESYDEYSLHNYDYIFIASKTTANNDISNNLNKNKYIFKNNTRIIIF